MNNFLHLFSLLICRLLYADNTISFVRWWCGRNISPITITKTKFYTSIDHQVKMVWLITINRGNGVIWNILSYVFGIYVCSNQFYFWDNFRSSKRFSINATMAKQTPLWWWRIGSQIFYGKENYTHQIVD